MTNDDYDPQESRELAEAAKQEGEWIVDRFFGSSHAVDDVKPNGDRISVIAEVHGLYSSITAAHIAYHNPARMLALAREVELLRKYRTIAGPYSPEDAECDSLYFYCVDCGHTPDEPHHSDCVVSQLDSLRAARW